jgi:hypothetical protein
MSSVVLNDPQLPLPELPATFSPAENKDAIREVFTQ